MQKPGLGTEARLLPDVLLTTDSWNTLVRPGAKRVSNEPDSATKHPHQNSRQANFNIRSRTSRRVCKNQYQRMEHSVLLSTPVPVTDLMTDRRGNVLEVVPDKPGSASWRSMSVSLQMLLGRWLVIATSGGRNDLWPVKRSSE